MGEIADNVTS